MFHLMHADIELGRNIAVRSSDTDILVILVKKVQNNLWFDTGLDYDNSHTFVDIKAVFEMINYVQALPGIYAFTEIMYQPFSRKGKNDHLQ